jgi:hypothetical protein
MARLTLFATAGQDVVANAAQQELVATFEAALAVLVADGASPTQAHVTTANNAYTNVKAIWAKDLVVDYDRANINTANLKQQALRAMLQQMLNVG